jgi:myo-inositol-1(or 4)-monophosphatase
MDSSMSGPEHAMDAANLKNGFSSQILRRIEEALRAAAHSISPFLVEVPRVMFKSGRNPVTEADRIANRVLRDALLQDGEGWLSEESIDDLSRLGKKQLWVVDPIDGTREFISQIPEWCISVGYIDNGNAVAGGICNPVTGEFFLGSIDDGVKLNGVSVTASRRQTLKGAVVLASRSEVERGEWECFREAPFVTRPLGSVAYKLAQVATGKADATWTSCPKHEWDIAAGVALVKSAGGYVRNLDGSELCFNKRSPLLAGLLACAPGLDVGLSTWLRRQPKYSESQ